MRKLTEGFRSGKALSMMPKIINIINKRTSNDYMFSPMVGNWKDSRGKWSAYEAYATSGEVLRFKFALGKSDVIKEVEYLENYSDAKSKYIIDLEGFNIVQVLDYITDVLTGEFAKYSGNKLAASKKSKNNLEEAGTKVEDSVKKWMIDSDLVHVLSRSSERDLEDYLPQYNQYASLNSFRTTNSVNGFKYNCKRALKAMKVNNDIAAVSVVAGETSTTIVDSTEQTLFDDEVIENEHLIKYQLMEIAINRIRDGDPNLAGVYIYGTGGVGKSFYATQELGPLPNTVYKSGAIQGYTGLLEILYPNRHGMIIVLDDIISPALIKNGNVENIFKGALGSTRHVDIIRPGSSATAESKTKNQPKLNEEDFFDVDSLTDFNDTAEDKYNFDFTSKIVFITNIPYVPEAFADRVETANMILTKEQIIDVIKSKLEFLVTDVDTEDKYFYFEWLRTNIRWAKKISFREYEKGLRMYLAMKDMSNWENMMRVRLKSGIAPKY